MDQPIIGIRFVEAGPIVYCSPGALDLGVGDYVIVRMDQGERLGWVVVAADQVISATIEGAVRAVDRLASEADVEAHREQKRRAEEDIGRAQAVATRLDPRIRVASLTYNLAGDRAELTYTAKDGNAADRLRRELNRAFDGVDFRVDLAGDRDRAKALGALGVCGRELCCSTWMTDFPAISIKMAKDQGLAPNPSKISGVCGRLLCCLSFEVEAYREIIGTLPRVGKRVTTPLGRAKVLSINAITETVRLRFDEGGQVIEMPAAQLRAQYGTAVRPEDLQEQVEAAVRAEDQRLQESLIAVLEPVSERPPGGRSWTPVSEDVPAMGTESDERAAGRRQGRRTPATGGLAGGGIRIERRRPADPGEGPEHDQETRAATPAEGGEKRRRRRGKRGGRRRRRPGGESPE